jgi:Zn-dependent protease with chaperone function
MMMDFTKPESQMDKLDNSQITSYWYLRNAIGWIGLLMPTWVKFGAYFREDIGLLTSISAYYYTSMRDVFVATLVLVGVLLACYRTDKLSDNIVAFVAGLAGVGIGLFPMNPEFAEVLINKHPCLQTNTCYLGTGILGFHLFFVAVFFALTFYMVFFRFGANTKPAPSTRKITRNILYKICGSIMFMSFAAIAYMRYTHNPNIYLPETLAILAFATAWLVKGQAIVWDPEHKPRIVKKIQDLNVK